MGSAKCKRGLLLGLKPSVDNGLHSEIGEDLGSKLLPSGMGIGRRLHELVYSHTK